MTLDCSPNEAPFAAQYNRNVSLLISSSEATCLEPVFWINYRGF